MIKVPTIVFIFSVAFIITTGANAYDNNDTHRRITRTAIPASKLDNYLQQQLGMPNGFDEIMGKNKIADWIQEGSYLEDIPNCRASNHFHNPRLPWTQSFMTDQPAIITLVCSDWLPLYSNVTWATNYLSPPPGGSKTTFSSMHKTYNWDGARLLYYQALILQFNGVRNDYFAQTFLELGHVLHLLQDMAVPAHTRNDFQSHLFKNATSFLGGYFDRYQPFEKYVEINPTLVTSNPPVIPSFNSARLTDFWDTNTYNGSNPSTLSNIGLAEYTNANYFSDYTIPTNNPTPEHSFPYPYIVGSNASGPSYQICVDYAQNSLEKRKYISRNAGSCPQPSIGRTADHFAAASLMNPEPSITNANIANLKLWLDNNVHNTYAKELLPRAVGYSAGLLNYFFRGTLDISAPDEYVYSIIDGSKDPQQFTKIKANIKNTTSSEAMQAGSLIAVAKYGLRTDYKPDLSADPPHTSSRSADFSYSVSAPIAITSLGSTIPTAFTFDFTQNPIPAGITDLYLNVIFKGTLGNEKDTAIAVGMKDLVEPTHQVWWNLSDMFSLNGHLYTASQIRNNPDLLAIVTSHGDNIDPYNVDFKFAYYGANPPGTLTTVAEVQQLPPGRHVRLLSLVDSYNANHVRLTWNDGVYPESYYDFNFSGGWNEETDNVFYYSSPQTFKSVIAHDWQGVLHCDPLNGPLACAYPESEAIAPPTLAPYPATIKFP